MKWASPFALKRAGILGMNRRNVAYIGQYNKRSLYPLVDNKLKTKLLAEKHQVTVPRLLGVVQQQHEIEHVAELVTNFASFAIKPAKGSGGKGIFVGVHRAGFGDNAKRRQVIDQDRRGLFGVDTKCQVIDNFDAVDVFQIGFERARGVQRQRAFE